MFNTKKFSDLEVGQSFIVAKDLEYVDPSVLVKMSQRLSSVPIAKTTEEKYTLEVNAFVLAKSVLFYFRIDEDEVVLPVRG